MMRSVMGIVGIVAFAAAGTGRAQAQDVIMQAPVAGAAVEAQFVVEGPGPELGLVAVEPFDSARAVVGAPYSAQAVTEVTHTLADGNRIERRTSAAIARDSRGRIRREHQAMVFGALMAESRGALVSISDPATGTHITLDPDRRVAFRMQAPKLAAMRENFAVALPPLASGKMVGVGANLTASTDARTESIGSREIEGVRADGTRTTMTIPAEAIGNQLPIEIVSERWYSPELQVVVLTRRSDPRFGETVYRLTNIVRAEPAADLFVVPSDYRVEEPAMKPGRRIQRR